MTQPIEQLKTDRTKEAKASQEAVALFAEYQKTQLLEQRLIGVATPLLVAMITNQGILFAASLTAEVDVEMYTQEKMIEMSVELATQLIEKISKTVNN